VDADVIDLRAKLAVLRRRWPLLLIVTLLGLALALGASVLQPRLYTATAEVLINPVGDFADTSGVVEPEELNSQALVIDSQRVAKRVVRSESLPDTPQQLLDSVTVAAVTRDGVGETRALSISVVRADPEGAASIANEFVAAYVDFRKAEETQRIDAERDALLEQLDQLSESIASAGSRTERQSLGIQRAGLLTQLAALNSGGNSAPGAAKLNPATPPNTPTQPKPLRLALLGGALGVLFGIALVFTRDHLDDAIRDESRLRGALGTTPVLAGIPRSTIAKQGRVDALIAPQSGVSEAYRALSTSVRFLLAPSRDNAGQRRNSVLVSSAVAGEGKTSVAANLAVSAARIGLNVILVDADLRHPRVAQKFGIEGAPGLSDVLATGAPVADHLLGLGVEGLRLLPGGTVPPNPAELLASPGAQAVFSELAASADLVVVDAAPILPVADTLELLAPNVLLLLVARTGLSRARSVEATIERIESVGASVAGVVWIHMQTPMQEYGFSSSASDAPLSIGPSAAPRDAPPPDDPDAPPPNEPRSSWQGAPAEPLRRA
jgi:succinoglycan biosynthesis transport protein ExoP